MTARASTPRLPAPRERSIAVSMRRCSVSSEALRSTAKSASATSWTVSTRTPVRATRSAGWIRASVAGRSVATMATRPIAASSRPLNAAARACIPARSVSPSAATSGKACQPSWTVPGAARVRRSRSVVKNGPWMTYGSRTSWPARTCSSPNQARAAGSAIRKMPETWTSVKNPAWIRLSSRSRWPTASPSEEATSSVTATGTGSVTDPPSAGQEPATSVPRSARPSA